MEKRYWRPILAGLALVIGLPLAGHWARRSPERRCAFDGDALDATYRVRAVDDTGRQRDFCCIACAEAWLDRRPAPPQAVYVTDERSGREVEAAAAYFVWSVVVTRPSTGNQVHAFADRADAEQHARAGPGRLLEGEERPFLRR